MTMPGKKSQTARLLREIRRRQTSPAELAAREAHRRAEAEEWARQRQLVKDRMTAAIAAVLPVDPDDGVVIVGYAPDNIPTWGRPETWAARPAEAALQSLRPPAAVPPLTDEQRAAIEELTNRGGETGPDGAQVRQ